MAWISTKPIHANRKSLLNHRLARSNLTGFLPGIGPDERGHTPASSVYRLYTIYRIGFRFLFFVRNSVVYSGFRVNEVYLLLGSLVTLAGVMAILPASGTPNVSPASGHYPSGLPVVSQIYLDGFQ